MYFDDNNNGILVGNSEQQGNMGQMRAYTQGAVNVDKPPSETNANGFELTDILNDNPVQQTCSYDQALQSHYNQVAQEPEFSNPIDAEQFRIRNEEDLRRKKVWKDDDWFKLSNLDDKKKAWLMRNSGMFQAAAAASNEL